MTEANADKKQTELMTLMAAEWKELSDEDKQARDARQLTSLVCPRRPAKLDMLAPSSVGFCFAITSQAPAELDRP